jgi:hypothetical protein
MTRNRGRCDRFGTGRAAACRTPHAKVNEIIRSSASGRARRAREARAQELTERPILGPKTPLFFVPAGIVALAERDTRERGEALMER